MISPVMKPDSGDARKRTAWREFLGLAEAADRDLRQQGGALRLGQLLGDHRRPHVGRRDRVHGDAVRRELAREREGERRERALRDRVRGAGGEAAGLRGERADVDDAAPAARLHRRHDRLSPEQRAVEVGAENAAPLGVAGRLELVVRQDAGVVDQDVDGAERSDDARVRSADRVGVADVAGEGADASCRTRTRAAASPRRRCRPARRGSRPRSAPAPTARPIVPAGAGDDRHLVLRNGPIVHVSSTLFLPNRPRERKVTTAMNSRYIDSSDHSDA